MSTNESWLWPTVGAGQRYWELATEWLRAILINYWTGRWSKTSRSRGGTPVVVTCIISTSISKMRVPCTLPRFALPAVDVSFEKHKIHVVYIWYSLSEEEYPYVRFI